MQDRYTGDIGDFGKYALLKALTGHDLRLGVVWYLNPDEEANADGNFIAYPALRECDPALHDSLMEIVANGQRRVGAVESRPILPPGTLFYSAPLTFRDLAGYDRAARCARRVAWVRGALTATVGADLVFVDPDNGLPGRSANPVSNAGQKYAFPDDLAGFVGRGQSLIIYHHQTREHGGLDAQIAQKFAVLRSLGSGIEPWALIFRRRSVRVYFVVPAAEHLAVLVERSRRFVESIWGQKRHFELSGA